jgi:hypothetical protein
VTETKKMFKVLAAVQKSDGTGEWWARCGKAYENRDGSFNLYLDLLPAGGNPKGGVKLQVRELDARDLEQIETNRANAANRTSAAPSHRSTASESLPF